jgi:hypothetical protein
MNPIITDVLFWYISVCFVLLFFFNLLVVWKCLVSCSHSQVFQSETQLHSLMWFSVKNVQPALWSSRFVAAAFAACNLPSPNYYIGPWSRPVLLAILITLNSPPARHNSVTGTQPVTVEVATAPPYGRDDTTFTRQQQLWIRVAHIFQKSRSCLRIMCARIVKWCTFRT